MITEHRILFSDSKDMRPLSDESTDLVVTSPPYPMIEMWDEMFVRQDPAIGHDLVRRDGFSAFERMHALLDRTWAEAYRILKPGGFACINIGDATRTMGDRFCLYPNHSRILSCALALGFAPLPCILWRKQTNAPNKFMGSGMLPAGAYVTLEHEYVLVLRKGGKRQFPDEAAKANRRASAIFWEERNLWFSDVWFDVKGTRQGLGNKETRARSGAYPFDLAYRLINMYSVKGDTVVDPFLGTGTTVLAAMTAGRHSVGIEIDPALERTVAALTTGLAENARRVVGQRLADHAAFADDRTAARGPLKYTNLNYGFPVVTAQERELLLDLPIEAEAAGENRIRVAYARDPETVWDGEPGPEPAVTPVESGGQMTLF